jgi:hypothetical protein
MNLQGLLQTGRMMSDILNVTRTDVVQVGNRGKLSVNYDSSTEEAYTNACRALCKQEVQVYKSTNVSCSIGQRILMMKW